MARTMMWLVGLGLLFVCFIHALDNAPRSADKPQQESVRVVGLDRVAGDVVVQELSLPFFDSYPQPLPYVLNYPAVLSVEGDMVVREITGACPNCGSMVTIDLEPDECEPCPSCGVVFCDWGDHLAVTLAE